MKYNYEITVGTCSHVNAQDHLGDSCLKVNETKTYSGSIDAADFGDVQAALHDLIRRASQAAAGQPHELRVTIANRELL
jgi:hypothetical protein